MDLGRDNLDLSPDFVTWIRDDWRPFGMPDKCNAQVQSPPKVRAMPTFCRVWSSKLRERCMQKTVTDATS